MCGADLRAEPEDEAPLRERLQIVARASPANIGCARRRSRSPSPSSSRVVARAASTSGKNGSCGPSKREAAVVAELFEPLRLSPRAGEILRQQGAVDFQHEIPLSRSTPRVDHAGVRRDFDVCVIGTGAGGGVMIDELTRAGFDVVALERGPTCSLATSTTTSCATSIRDQVFSPDQLETYRLDAGSAPRPVASATIAHCVGGTMTHWSGWSWRFRPDEFKVLSTEGPVAGREPRRLADLDYAELEPFYERAEWDFGVSGDGRRESVRAPRKKGYPNPSHPARLSSPVVRRAARKRRASSVPGAGRDQLRSPTADAPRCMYGGACRGYGCPIHAKATTFSVSIPRARATGRLDLRADARVFELPVTGRPRHGRALPRSRRATSTRCARATSWCRRRTRSARRSCCCSRPRGRFRTGSPTERAGRRATCTFHHHPAARAASSTRTCAAYTGFEAYAAIDDLHRAIPKRGFIRGGVVAELNTFTHQPIALRAHAEPAHPRLGAGAGARRSRIRMRAFPRTITVGGHSARICRWRRTASISIPT